MSHYDCKYCDASPMDEHDAECPKADADQKDRTMTNEERVARAIHESVSQIPWDATNMQDIAFVRARAAIAAMEPEIRADERRKQQPQWFYLAGDMSSDCCRFSPSEVIDEDWLWDNRASGDAVVQIETATPCPDIWCAVHFFTDEEKDARKSDDEYEITEFATEAEAQAAIRNRSE